MRIVVEPGLCDGHAECVIAAPEVFDLNSAGDEVVLLQEAPEPDLWPKVDSAVRLCPVAALRITED
jgi:ferredoxin